MKFKQIQKKLLLNAVIFIFLLTGANIFTAATSGAATCFNAVQNKVAYDYKGHKRWSPANIKRLCRSAERSREPAVCFNRVMHGGVNYGGGTKWQWKNALNLCKGSKNANATIACFERKVNRGISWRTAIKNCNHITSPVVRDHRRPPPVVRDRVRRPPPPAVRGHRPPPPAVRDHRRPPPVAGGSGKYKQWMIGANSSGYIYPKSSWGGPSGRNYNLKGFVNKKFLQYEEQGAGRGINLGWTDNASAKTATSTSRWFFSRKSGSNNTPLRYGEPIAIGLGKSPSYIKYASRNMLSINLDWSKSPSYEWMILGGRKGDKIRKGKDWVAIYNIKHQQPLIFFRRSSKAGADIGWPDSTRVSVGGVAKGVGKKVYGAGKKVYGVGEDIYGAGRDIYRKFEPKSKKLARFNNKRKNCKKKKDTCTNCFPPKANVDLDKDSIPDLLEYNLAYKFFPQVMLYGKKYDLDQAYLYKGYATPFIVRPIRGGQCKRTQCLEIRLGITFLYDAGDDKDYANWFGHTGDSEMYTVVVKRNASWAQSRNNVNNWQMIRDFTSAHWGKAGFDSSAMKSYPLGKSNRVTLYSSTMKHALYHSHDACERGAKYQDSCKGRSYDLSIYKDRKLQNIGDLNQHAQMDTTIEHPECGVYDVWSNRGFAGDEKVSHYFTKRINYNLGSKVRILGGVNLTPWCKSKYGSKFKAKLIGKTAGDWTCEQSRGNRRSLSVTSACKLQYGKKAKKSKALDWNDPYSWKCISF